jgi:hypothetical protein
MALPHRPSPPPLQPLVTPMSVVMRVTMMMMMMKENYFAHCVTYR